MKVIKGIIAADENGVIGHNNRMPGWILTDDFKQNFVPKTKGYTVIMGANTAESLPGPLKNRKNIAITRNPERGEKLRERGYDVADSLDAAVAMAMQLPGDIIWVIGGAQILGQAFARDLISELHLTIVHGSFPAPAGVQEIKFPDNKGSYSFLPDPKQTKEYKKRPPSEGDRGNSHDFTVEVQLPY